jgi:hypothetical protein
MWPSLICLISFGLFGCAPKDQTFPMRSAWPNLDWQEYAYSKVYDMPKASDEKEFCPKGLTQRNWVHLLAAMAKYESNYNPKLEYKEAFKNGKGETVISTGLFQVSYESSGLVRKGTRHEELHNPKINIDIATDLIRYYVKRDGVVANHSGEAWRGASRYWSVMRPKHKRTINGKEILLGKLPEIKAHMKQWCEDR